MADRLRDAAGPQPQIGRDGPGLTVLTRMPFGPTSFDSALQKPAEAIGARQPGPSREGAPATRSRNRFQRSSWRWS